MNLNRPKHHVEQQRAIVAPKFVEQFTNQLNLMEGDHAYFSAKLNHPNLADLQVENNILTYAFISINICKIAILRFIGS